MQSLPCPSGAYCPAGSTNYIICPDRTFQNLPQQSTCNTCPAGYYCLNSGIINNAKMPTICPAGSFCPSRSSAARPCPQGTYSIELGLTQQSDCVSCPAGFYCIGGQSSVSGKCKDGYYCLGSAYLDMPQNDNTGGICPQGFYCPATAIMGNANPIPCPPGTYNDAFGATDSSFCLLCQAGYFCPLRGGTSATYFTGTTYQCHSGYLCIQGSVTPYPNEGGVTGRPCNPGYYCSAGASSESPCLEGTYNPYLSQGSCLTCPAGKLCDVQMMTTFKSCPAGSYCSGGSSVPTPCDAGTYSPLSDLSLSSECLSCDPGFSCPNTGMTSIGPACDAGYVCTGGSTSATPPTPYSFPDNNNGECPPGYFCPAQSSAPTPCPIGQYQPNSMQTSCLPCPGGVYCPYLGMSTSSLQCNAGYICVQCSTHAQPINLEIGRAHV